MKTIQLSKDYIERLKWVQSAASKDKKKPLFQFVCVTNNTNKQHHEVVATDGATIHYAGMGPARRFPAVPVIPPDNQTTQSPCAAGRCRPFPSTVRSVHARLG